LATVGSGRAGAGLDLRFGAAFVSAEMPDDVTDTTRIITLHQWYFNITDSASFF
jgi:hypothetical protein